MLPLLLKLPTILVSLIAQTDLGARARNAKVIVPEPSWISMHAWHLVGGAVILIAALVAFVVFCIVAFAVFKWIKNRKRRTAAATIIQSAQGVDRRASMNSELLENGFRMVQAKAMIDLNDRKREAHRVMLDSKLKTERDLFSDLIEQLGPQVPLPPLEARKL